MKRKDNIAPQLGCQGFELQGSGTFWISNVPLPIAG